ncbi:MAG: hypothetical protein WA912_13830, partial [Ornithinimicrobium sp.]
AFAGVLPGLEQGAWSAVMSALVLSVVLLVMVIVAVAMVDRPTLRTIIDGAGRRPRVVTARGEES